MRFGKMIHTKYPRTFHLSWSPGVTNDDKVMKSTISLNNMDVVVLEKRDGEGITMYNDGMHARSLTSERHFSRFYVQQMHGKIRHRIPSGWRICGENLHYMKSIKYHRLNDFFEVFSIWNAYNMCLSWEDTVKWCKILDLQTTPLIWQGKWDPTKIQAIKINPKLVEGYVVRPRLGFDFSIFNHVVGKYVREGHVQTSEHWKNHTHLHPNIKIR